MNYLSIEDLAGCSTISVEEAAVLIGISRTAMYEAVNRGEFGFVRIGRRIRVLARPLYSMLAGASPPTSGNEVQATVNPPESGPAEGGADE